MATSQTTVLDGVDQQIYDVIADADGDTSHAVAHTLGVVPVDVQLTHLSAPARISDWIVTGITDTTVTVAKTTTAGSGDPAAQLRVRIAAAEAPRLG